MYKKLIFSIILVLIILLIFFSGCVQATQSTIEHEHPDEVEIVFLENNGNESVFKMKYNSQMSSCIRDNSIFLGSDTWYYIHRQQYAKFDGVDTDKGVLEVEKELSKDLYVTENIVYYHRGIDKNLLKSARKNHNA